MKQTRSRDLLVVAFHYPPIVGSSGVYRTLSFTRHLADEGYHVEVVTAALTAYESWSPEQYELIPSNVKVRRAFALEVTKHLSFKGKYFSFMSLPDNWQSWILGGFFTGLWSAFKRKPKLIFSTYPIASAHIIGYLLHKVLGVPWVADLRDPMAQKNYPADPRKKKIFLWIERKIVEKCQFAIVTTPGAKAFYLEKFPDSNPDFWKVLPNGFDDKTFNSVIESVSQDASISQNENDKLVLLHSGIIYPKERNPNALFEAVSELKIAGELSAATLEIRLRATGHDEIYAKRIAELDIADIIKLEPTISYKEAIAEMMSADGFLLMQSQGCNHQIPAKSYEYIKLKKPILGLMPEEGDTGQLISNLNIAELAPLDDKDKTKEALLRFIQRLTDNEFVMPADSVVNSYSRSAQAVELTKLIDELE
ncbi:glycosyltransferase [Aliiglaciecola sp.]|nr:glycosyltransferase [Aliiglaciecola sp.]